MTYRELGKKVLEQAGKPLSVKEIFEKACEMGLDKECNGGKILPHSLGSTLSQDKKQFYVTNNKKDPFIIGSNLVKENFHHKKPQTPKMMNRASVQAQPKNKKTLFMKGFYTHCL
ncbi:hypothetical protein BB390_06505 [Helicobacter pylori]|nr:hypothetical protein BB390_06505 [Helicobacter pylori]